MWWRSASSKSLNELRAFDYHGAQSLPHPGAMVMRIILTLLPLLAASALQADPAKHVIRQTGGSFIEAPPGRDKQLPPMGTFGAGEKVEAHAVISFSNRLVVEMPTFGKELNVTATALKTDNTRVALGSAESFGLRGVSTDGKSTLLSLSVSRLPDAPVTAVEFSGSIRLNTASNQKRYVNSFQRTVGTKLDLGPGTTVKISKLEGNNLTLAGDQNLARISAIKLTDSRG